MHVAFDFALPGSDMTTIQFGLCLPESCNVEDALSLVPEVVQKSLNNVESSVQNDYCLENPLTLQIITIAFLITGLILSIMFTIWSKKYTEDFQPSWWTSLDKNLNVSDYSLKNRIEINHDESRVDTFDVLKFWAIGWSLLFACFTGMVPVINNGQAIISAASGFVVLSSGGHLAIECLFFMSAMLSTKSLLAKMEKESDYFKQAGLGFFRHFVKRWFYMRMVFNLIQILVIFLGFWSFLTVFGRF